MAVDSARDWHSGRFPWQDFSPEWAAHWGGPAEHTQGRRRWTIPHFSVPALCYLILFRAIVHLGTESYLTYLYTTYYIHTRIRLFTILSIFIKSPILETIKSSQSQKSLTPLNLTENNVTAIEMSRQMNSGIAWAWERKYIPLFGLENIAWHLTPLCYHICVPGSRSLHSWGLDFPVEILV